MKYFLLTFITSFLFCLESISQIITVIDNEDLKPVPDVAVLNESTTKFIYTNRTGNVDISSFKDEIFICFQHFTYERICLSLEEIRKMSYQVKLTRKIFAIEEFVVSANRWEQNRKEVPNKITSILKPSIDLQNPQTSADLLGISDEVFIQKSQLGGGSPMIRGFATNRILIVVDGVRMNNAIYREGNIQNVISLDPSMLESAEIIFGPGASVYGSDAIGGVMDFHTKKALVSTGDKPYLKSDAFTRFSSADNEKTFHFDFNLGGKRLAFLSGFTWSDYGDLKMGSVKHDDYLRPEYVEWTGNTDSVVLNSDPRIQRFSGYKQLNTLNKFRYRISGNIDLVFSNHYSRLSDVPRYDRLIQYRSGKPRYGEWYYGPQVWTMNELQLILNKENCLFDKLEITGALQNYRESRHDRSFGKTTINEQSEKVNIFSLNVDFDKELNQKEDLLYYGTEFVTNDISSDAQTRDVLSGVTFPAGSRYPNGTNKYKSFSLYAGYKNNFSKTISFSTGLRYNFVSLNSRIADNSYNNFPFTVISLANSAITAATGVVIRIKEDLQLNLNASTGFRAPNLDDAGKIFDSAPGVVVVPNPGLKPEYAYNIDLGASKDFGKIFHFDITAYHTWLDNAMVRHDFLFNGEDSVIYGGELSKVEAITNAGSARVSGISLNIQAKITGHLLLKSSMNITEGKEDQGTPLRHAAPLFGATHLLIDYSKLKIDLYSAYNGPKRYSKMPPTEIEKPYMYATDNDGKPWSPGWLTFNLKLSYDILAKLSIFAGVENILDIRYRPYSSGIVSPGRNFILSLRTKV